ncbi:unnamed product, partial [Ostreococcus tauri]
AVSLTSASNSDVSLTSAGTGDILLTSTDDITLDAADDVTIDAAGVLSLAQGGTSILSWTDAGAVTLSAKSGQDLTLSGDDVVLKSEASSTLALKQDSTSILSWDASGAVTLNSVSGQDLTLSTGGSARVTVDSTGQVGIGKTNPSYDLDVTGTSRITSNLNVEGTLNFPISETVAVGTKINLNSAGTLTIGTTSRNNSLGTPQYYNQYTAIWGHLFMAGTTELVRLTADGRLGIGLAPEKNLDVQGEGRVSGAFTVGGALSKSSGSFKIDHPLPEMSHTHDLYHSFIEGPRADLIYRGKVRLQNGRATINIDAASNMTFGTFEALNRDVQSFTSNESDWDPVRGSVVGNVLTIECQNPMSTALISWMVIGERHDQHMYDTEWTDENGRVVPEQLKKSATT